MLRTLSHILTLFITLSSSAVSAADRVVVLPLNSAKKIKNVVTVSATGGNFTNPVAAINSITNASAANPYLLQIGPGVYTLTQPLVMKPYVPVIPP
jgi:pectin methylesterase-like acyl-CoA thioesterase